MVHGSNASSRHTCFIYVLLLLSLVSSSVKANPSKDAGDRRTAVSAALARRFLEILEQPLRFRDEEEEFNCKKLLDSLSAEEETLAAQTSYAYWYMEQHDNTCPPPVLKKLSAIKEVRRHLVASNGDVVKALDRLKETCRYRKEYHIDLLRKCFSENQSGALEVKLKDMVYGDMTSQPVIMKGNDNEGRAVLFKGSRVKEGGGSEEEYLTTQLYIAERANACTEFVSRGRHEKMVAVFDFSTYQSAHAPPIKWQLSAIRKIQYLYPERLHKLILLEPPLWVRAVYHSLRGFLPSTTQGKIQLVKDRKELKNHVDISIDLAPQSSVRASKAGLATATGTNIFENKLIGWFDVAHYLNDIPFFCPYDCDRFLDNDDAS